MAARILRVQIVSFVTFLAIAGGFPLASAKGQKSELDPHADRPMNLTIHCYVPMGEGLITAINSLESKVGISHKPDHSIGFDEMNMSFGVSKRIDLSAFAVGERVHFLLKLERGKEDYIAALCSFDSDKDAYKSCMKEFHNEAMRIAAATIVECTMDDMESP